MRSGEDSFNRNTCKRRKEAVRQIEEVREDVFREAPQWKEMFYRRLDGLKTVSME